ARVPCSFFFFSSRRRHTRFSRDWSSDVCSSDLTDLLGNTLAEIAGEKAGIIKKNVPVVLSERDETIAHIFERKALEMGAPLRFRSEERRVGKEGRARWAADH